MEEVVCMHIILIWCNIKKKGERDPRIIRYTTNQFKAQILVIKEIFYNEPCMYIHLKQDNRVNMISLQKQ